MTDYAPQPQITVLDTGGQYTHLIARKVRELGVYAEVRLSETPATELTGRKGIIISGGPASVYEAGSPTMDPAILKDGHAVLGICYGQQLMAHLLDGVVEKGTKGEYGAASLRITNLASPLLKGLEAEEPVWMSHRDTVLKAPTGFEVLATTSTCAVAAIGSGAKRQYGVQFHPEVVHTRHGMKLLRNFLFDICGCIEDWEPRHRIPVVEEKIREVVGNRKVFFFVSGGVDSTVAFALCLQALGSDRVQGAYVDTGLMRKDETEFVKSVFARLGATAFRVEDARDFFLGKLAGADEPEQKRKIIGEAFVDVQDKVLNSGHYLDQDWILGQGTIYPDTIESGGTAKADLIKTHHNRVAGIQKLMDAGRIIEPLSSFYKDEVREIGRELGLPNDLLDRHPFPGPGLAIRCLCAKQNEPISRLPDGWLIPVHSVGVQGDSRSYRPVLAVETLHHESATELINRLTIVNRVIGLIASAVPMDEMSVRRSGLTAERLDRLREVDAIVRRLSEATGFESQVWQFPVVLIPLGTEDRPDSVVLRPIHSVDGMTASSVPLPIDLLTQLKAELLPLSGISAIFHDLTHKPPATIEWE